MDAWMMKAEGDRVAVSEELLAGLDAERVFALRMGEYDQATVEAWERVAPGDVLLIAQVKPKPGDLVMVCQSGFNAIAVWEEPVAREFTVACKTEQDPDGPWRPFHDEPGRLSTPRHSAPRAI